MKAPIPVAVTLLFVLVGVSAPFAQAHGAWWRAHDRDADFDAWGLDHTGHEVSTATRVEDPSQVLFADVQWSGQVLFGAPEFNGLLTLRLLDADRRIVHESVFPARESWADVVWVDCPSPPGGGINLETVIDYRVSAPGRFESSGLQRMSFCGDVQNFANDPYYFRQFSDYTGWYTALGTSGTVGCVDDPTACNPAGALVVPPGSQWLLHLHVRGLDHGG